MADGDDVAVCSQFLAKNVKSKVLVGKSRADWRKRRSAPALASAWITSTVDIFSCHEMTKGFFVTRHKYIDSECPWRPRVPFPDQAFLVLERGSRNLTEYAKEIRYHRHHLFKDLMLDVLAIIGSAHKAQYVLIDVTVQEEARTGLLANDKNCQSWENDCRK